MINIEIQYFTGCSNSQKMIDAVKEAVKDLHVEINYTETLVETDEKANAIKFRGSPTLLIDGNDFEDMPAPEKGSLSCRYYENGIPTVEEIIQKIKGSK